MLRVRELCRLRGRALINEIGALEKQARAVQDKPVEVERIAAEIARLRSQIIDSSYALRRVCDLKSPTTANQIWKNEMQKIGLDTIEALCRGLKCGPDEIFAFDPPLVRSNGNPGHRRAASPPNQAGRKDRKGKQTKAGRKRAPNGSRRPVRRSR